ncbi:MAG TPA: cytochrome C oxidase subunit IV family protein [Candidatus Polarisedimenticolia bacterium]|nr:cytochrome C oxidase subunit IV family protein [Candidatus Polarisedimenticolia bacterium]
MEAAEHKEPNYMGVFWALLVLTLAEVGIFYLHLPKLVMIISLITMALAKAGLVAAYFMHLALEKRTLALIVVSPLILSAVIIIGLTPDSVFNYPRKPPERWVLPGQEEPQQGTEPAGQPAPAPDTKPAAPQAPADGGPA